MKRMKIKIMYQDPSGDWGADKNFDISLWKTGWFTFDGNWGCLPGYMKKIAGYFSLLTAKGSCLQFWDRDMTNTEVLLSDRSKVNLYMSLDEFPDSPKSGQKGQGQFYQLGAKIENERSPEKNLVRRGFASSRVKWEIIEVV